MIVVIILPLSWVLVSYKGPKRFAASAEQLPPLDKVIENARSLSGTLYDPLMGQYDNLGGRMGFIVCSDVPNIAFGLAGFSLERLLIQDFKKHSAFYNGKDGNSPGNPYFHRRARNLYAYFKANRTLHKPSVTPKVGDFAFYKKAKDAYISHVTLVSEVKGKQYQVMESAPKTLVAMENSGESPVSRGWVLMGFGRLY